MMRTSAPDTRDVLSDSGADCQPSEVGHPTCEERLSFDASQLAPETDRPSFDEEHLPFDELVTRHDSTVRRAIRQVVGRHRDEDDLVQEVFLRLAIRLRQPGALSVVPWLRRVARNVAIDELRRRRPIPVGTDTLEAVSPGFASTGDEISVALEAADLGRIAGQAIAGLPARQRDALLSRMQGTAPGGVGATSMSTEARDSLVARARRQLRRDIGEAWRLGALPSLVAARRWCRGHRPPSWRPWFAARPVMAKMVAATCILAAVGGAGGWLVTTAPSQGVRGPVASGRALRPSDAAPGDRAGARAPGSAATMAASASGNSRGTLSPLSTREPSGPSDGPRSLAGGVGLVQTIAISPFPGAVPLLDATAGLASSATSASVAAGPGGATAARVLIGATQSVGTTQSTRATLPVGAAHTPGIAQPAAMQTAGTTGRAGAVQPAGASPVSAPGPSVGTTRDTATAFALGGSSKRLSG